MIMNSARQLAEALKALLATDTPQTRARANLALQAYDAWKAQSNAQTARRMKQYRIGNKLKAYGSTKAFRDLRYKSGD